jgi:hypothetical protein
MGITAGARVSSAGGVESEAEVTFSGLHQAMLPLQDGFGQLTDRYRDALNVALGFGEGAVPDRLLVANATLSALLQAAEAQPLLLIIDDLPWLDRTSAVVLSIVARRLSGSRVSLLAASRTGEDSFFERAGLPELELGPLDDHAALALISNRFPSLAPAVRVRLLAEAEGNPLAVLELPAALSGPQRADLACGATRRVGRSNAPGPRRRVQSLKASSAPAGKERVDEHHRQLVVAADVPVS